MICFLLGLLVIVLVFGLLGLLGAVPFRLTEGYWPDNSEAWILSGIIGIAITFVVPALIMVIYGLGCWIWRML